MTELIRLVNAVLNTIGDAYLEEAPQNKTFPYITFRFLPSIENYQREIFILQVDVWGSDNDTTEIEEISDRIDHVLHRMKYYDTDVLQTTIYRESREMVPDPDPNIRRRMLQFECKTYIRRSE